MPTASRPESRRPAYSSSLDIHGGGRIGSTESCGRSSVLILEEVHQ